MSFNQLRMLQHRYLLTGGLAVTAAGCLPIPTSSPAPQANGPILHAAEVTKVKTDLIALARAQQLHFLETRRFAGSIDELQVAIPAESGIYQLAIAEVQPDRVVMTAKTRSFEAPNLSAGVFSVGTDESGNTLHILCEGESDSEKPPPVPQLVDQEAVCSE